jgi:hypothetical protein
VHAYLQIIAISSLNGRASSEDDEGAHICLLGMLSQITENQWYLEDPTGSVKLDLSEVEITTGLFTETSIVIAHGRMVGDKFRARYLSHAPAEPKKATLYAARCGWMGTVCSTVSDTHCSTKQKIKMTLCVCCGWIRSDRI